jgi:hypothetical protein
MFELEHRAKKYALSEVEGWEPVFGYQRYDNKGLEHVA